MFNKPSDLPVEQVRAMQDKGYDNNQIVEALKRNGYSSTQIFDALNQSNLKSGAPQDPPEGFEQGNDMNTPELSQAQGRYSGSDQAQQSGDDQYYAGSDPGASSEEVEELVERIIEEKWDELAQDINKVVEWKNGVEAKLIKLEQRFDSLQQDFDKVHQAILGKIGEYDKHIMNVGAEVKSMEKVFSKVLPVFTENVNELSRITDNIKKKK